ncbi:MAG: response regulator, partial [Rhodospirillaceae bacterium]|nr:response regulator [Rhodospirillaceae bacterium]
PPAKAGEFVMISISDTGTGMTDYIKEKLFNPFFTTKEIGQGGGLGLNMVHGFVERSGGYLEVYSELGSGTTFSIFLPRKQARPAEFKSVPRRQTLLPCGDETILIVDDEKDLLRIAVEYLKRLGYTTLTAENGTRALDILKTHPEVNLMFSDIIMPGKIDGYQLSLQAKDTYPELKILLTSGFTKRREEFTNELDPDRARLARNLLNKPYSDEELAFAVRQALDHD